MQSFDKLLGQIIDETTSRSKGQQTQKGDIIAVGTSNVKLNLESISQAVKNILSKAIKPAIIEGLNVVATVPPSMKVYIYPGYGTSGGEIHELYDRVTATISPYIELQYINLKGARVTVDTSPVRGSLGLAKIAVPKPPYTNKILDDMNPASDYDGYIISGKDILFNNNFLIDDESIPVIRNTMSKIFAEYIFGTITLSEALKIANVQGTMMANSNSITFYDTNGAELAYYGAREARIGNIKITPTTVQSRNFQAGSRGFQLKDDGNAEFDNITARGTIYADAGDIGDILINSGDIQSANYVGGISGFKLDSNGSAELSDITARGTIYASAGDIGDILINSGDIQTSNYIADSAGFKLNSNGNAEFNDLKARGTIYASGGDIGDILINSGDIQTSNYVTGVSGFKLNSTGNAEFSDIIARGDIYANSGYFSGTVYAQAGDITGNLYVGTGSPRILIDGVAKTIGTTDFASGYNGRGWRIDADGSITMQNGLFRGELHTSVFVKDEVHVTNGNLMVTNGSVIASGVDSGDTDIYINQGVFSVNDIIRLKNDTNSEYMQVTGVTGANDTKITVTRNLDATGANDWEQGECVASLGSRINIAASGDITRSGFSGTEGYLPYVDVIRRNSITWNDETVMVRMGNLTGVTHPLFGNLSGYGLFAQNVYLSGTMTASTIQTTNAANLGLKLTELGIKAWDSGNNQRVQILNDGSGWLGASNVFYWDNAGNVNVSELSALSADLGTITAGTVTGATIRTAASGARFNMDTAALVAYDDAVAEVFRVNVAGADVGDVVIGDWANAKGIKWDKSAGTFEVKISAQTRYYHLCPPSFLPSDSIFTYVANGTYLLLNDTPPGLGSFWAPVNLPQGAIVTSLKVYYFRNDASSSGSVALRRGTTAMANVAFNSTAGSANGEDTSIDYATIDNNAYAYMCELTLNTNDAKSDVYLFRVTITYTVTDPLP